MGEGWGRGGGGGPGLAAAAAWAVDGTVEGAVGVAAEAEAIADGERISSPRAGASEVVQRVPVSGRPLLYTRVHSPPQWPR
jgi:hypothetical protein